MSNPVERRQMPDPDTVIAEAARELHGWSEIDVDMRREICAAWRKSLRSLSEREAVLEEAAKVCDAEAERFRLQANKILAHDVRHSLNRQRSAAQDCAAAIRALKGEA